MLGVIVAGAAVWLVVSVLVAVVVGGVVRRRDRQVPRPDVHPSRDAVPAPRVAHGLSGDAGPPARAPRR